MNEMRMMIDELKWDVRQRLKLLESTLLLSGWVRTQALMETFGISRAQASKDFAVYQSLRPQNLVYNKSRKYYEASDDFEPLLLTGKSSELLDVLAAANRGDGPVLALATQTPQVEMMRPLDRELDLGVFRAISMAASNQRKVCICYQSMSSPEPMERIISPHTLVFSGFRWHVRAFSDDHGEFRDFVLARIRGSAALLDAAGVPSEQDQDWNSTVDVLIAPHPGLPKPQRAIIAEDYGMIDDVMRVPVRKALLLYFINLMQLDPTREHPDPARQQVRLMNPEILEGLI